MNSKLFTTCDYIAERAVTPYLIAGVWAEGTTMLLHGKREADKTAQALDMAIKVASPEREVVYVDTQSTLYNHVDRLRSAVGMFILRPSYSGCDDTRDYADIVIADIEEVIAATRCRVFVIDSLTRIAALSFGRNASAAYVLKRLMALRMRHGISLLVLSHDSTKATDRSLVNLADAVMAVETSDATDRSAPADSNPLIPAGPTLNRRQRREQMRMQRKQLRKTQRYCPQKKPA